MDHGEQVGGLGARGLWGKQERGVATGLSTLSEEGANLSEVTTELPSSLFSPRHPTTQDREPSSQREEQTGWLAGDVVFLFVFHTMPQKNILLMCN